MSGVRLIEALFTQISTDKQIQKYMASTGFHIGEVASRSLAGKDYLVHVLPQFEREDFDSEGTFDEPNEGLSSGGEVGEDQTNMVGHVFLVKARVNSQDLRNRIVGDGKRIGILEVCRLVKAAIAKRWDLGLNVEKTKIENTQYFARPRFMEVQITVVYWETVYETSRVAAFSSPDEELGVEDEPDLTMED